MALVFADGFDTLNASQLLTKWTSNPGGRTSLAGPGRIGYGQYLNCAGGGMSLQKGLTGAPYTTLIIGTAWYFNGVALSNDTMFGFYDNLGTLLCNVGFTATGQMSFGVGTAQTYFSSAGLVSPQTWAYVEAQITFSNGGTGSATIRLNGVNVLVQASINTAANGNGCTSVGPANNSNNFYDDIYVLNTTAPNNTFFGDIKVFPLYPAGNGRVDGWTRQGGTGAGNWTAVNDVPPDGDASYVYTATPGTEDCYTLTAISNIQTVKAVQLSAYARKDDTPSRVVSLGIGDGTNEFYDAGTSLNTTYTYILRQLDTDPVTSAAWVAANLASRQGCIKLIS